MSIKVNRTDIIQSTNNDKVEIKKSEVKSDRPSVNPFKDDSLSIKNNSPKNNSDVFSSQTSPKVSSIKISSAIQFNQRVLPMPLIKKVQENLGVTVTGVFDQATALKVMSFQKENNLVADGKIGKNTLNKLANNGLKIESGIYPKYDKMFEDNVLDVTVGVGYDETGWGDFAYNDLKNKLNDRGYKELSTTEQAEIFKKLNIPEMNNDAANVYYKENINTYKDKPVAGIIRVIHSNENDGTKAKEGFVKGLNNSDVTIYAGHGRYGTGMDFDRNLTIKATINGQTTEFKDYEDFEKELKNPQYTEILNKAPNIKTMNNRTKIDYLIEQKVIEIQSSNKGNIVVNEKSPHTNEFGGALIEKAINSSTDKPTLLLEAVSQSEKYKLWNLIGCRTDDYLPKIKSGMKNNPNLQRANLDIMTTKRVEYWNNMVDNALATIDGVSNTESYEQIKSRTENVDLEKQKNIVTITGSTDNPRIASSKK